MCNGGMLKDGRCCFNLSWIFCLNWSAVGIIGDSGGVGTLGGVTTGCGGETTLGSGEGTLGEGVGSMCFGLGQ